MALSIAQAVRRRDLINDRRRLQARVARNRRLSDEYKAMAAEDELALAAVEADFQAMERMRR